MIRSIALFVAAMALVITFGELPDRVSRARAAATDVATRAAEGSLAIRAVPVTAPGRAAAASGETMTTGAGAGLFPDGAELAGVRLSGSTFGTGALILASGSAIGTFQTVLAGTSALGLPQNITVEGKIGSGAKSADGSVTLSGSAIVDMGDGSVPSAGVPFSVTMTPGTLALVLGGTALPTQTLIGGSITIT